MIKQDTNEISGFDRDILEWNIPEEVLAVLLKDQSTGRNLIWATDDYAARNCHTLCDKLSWSHYRLPDIAKLEK